jgi:hypothetical protein
VVAATPTEQLMPCSSAIRVRSCSATCAGLPSRRRAPDTSRNASSSDIASTSGVTDRKVSITAADTAVKSRKSGWITTACGHSRRARIPGMADRTPCARAS